MRTCQKNRFESYLKIPLPGGRSKRTPISEPSDAMNPTDASYCFARPLVVDFFTSRRKTNVFSNLLREISTGPDTGIYALTIYMTQSRIPGNHSATCRKFVRISFHRMPMRMWYLSKPRFGAVEPWVLM